MQVSSLASGPALHEWTDSAVPAMIRANGARLAQDSAWGWILFAFPYDVKNKVGGLSWPKKYMIPNSPGVRRTREQATITSEALFLATSAEARGLPGFRGSMT